MPWPIRVALVNDYDVVVAGVARMLDGYSDRVFVAELDTNEDVEDVVDVVLYDNFAQPEADRDEVDTLVANPRAARRRRRPVRRCGSRLRRPAGRCARAGPR